ncbi:hypothetical protein M3Y97_00183700 [Aphelenchoides bicaudatus]|nr:hypothetical protein M3Y97_00183700 [Aphelenchoides bicaudatus]
MLIFSIFLLIFNEVNAVDPLFKHVVQLTFDGDHSFPSFSPDGRSIFFTAKGRPYTNCDCEHVYRMDRMKPANPVSLFSTGLGREFQATQIGSRYATLSTALKELEKLDVNSSSDISTSLFCPVSKCKAQEDEQVRLVCSKPHLERLIGSAVFRFSETGILTDLNYQTDFENGWISNEALHEENEKSFGRVFSVRCDHGECITVENEEGRHMPYGKIGWWDGFTQHQSLTSADIDLAFSGTEIDEFELDFVKLGIISLNASKIYTTTFKSLIEKHPQKPLVDDPRYAFMHPSFDSSTGDVIATRFNLCERSKTLVRINNKGEVKVMPNDSADYLHGVVSSDGQEIVFVSTVNGNGYQLYLGSSVDPASKTFKSKPFLNIPSPTKHLNETRNFCNMAHDEVSIKPKLSADGKWLLYGMATANSCNQIFQLYLPNNDISMPKKMTTGMHYFDSANYLGPNGTSDILYSGTLTKKVNMENIDMSCRIRKCYIGNVENDENLGRLCEKIGIEKGLPKDSDLYIADEYGHIKKRLTTSNMYNGEAIVSSDFKTVVFSRETEDDYELFKMDVDGGNLRQLTGSIGFEGDPVLSADSRYLAYYAWRPNTIDELERFVDMKNYGFTDLNSTQVFLYNMDTGLEVLVSDSCVRCHSPVFLPTNDKLLFINELNNKTKLLMAMDLIDFKNGSIPKVTTLDVLESSVTDISFSSNTDELVFVVHSMKNIYEITLGRFVGETSGSTSLLSNNLLFLLLFVIWTPLSH